MDMTEEMVDMMEESLLKAQQQLDPLSRRPDPARIHSHGSNRVCWFVEEAMDGNMAATSHINIPSGA